MKWPIRAPPGEQHECRQEKQEESSRKIRLQEYEQHNAEPDEQKREEALGK